MKNTLLVFFLVICLSTNGQIPASGLVSYYKFSNNNLNQVATNNSCVLYGCTYGTDRFGESSNSLSLNGTTDSVKFQVRELAPIIKDFTVSIWFNSTLQERSELLNLGNYLNSNNFTITLNGDAGVYVYWNGPGELFVKGGVTNDYTDGKWHNLVVSRESGLISLWVDNTIRDTTFYDQVIGVKKTFLIGDLVDNFNAGIYSNYHKYKGSVDDMAFYNIALNASEISQLFHDRQPLILLSPKNTEAYPLNSSCTIEWESTPSISKLRAEYRLNDQREWKLISNTIDASTHSYTWNLSFPALTVITVRISDLSNPSVFAISGDFKMSEYQWNLVKDTCNFSPRDGAGLLSFNNKLWLLGGWGDTLWLPPAYHTNQIWSSTDGVTWNFELDAPWEGRHTCGWLVYNKKMWVIGGDGNSGKLITDVWNSDDGINWNLVIDSLPMAGRVTHMTAVQNNRMLLFGGQQIYQYWDGAIDSIYNDVWESTDGVKWNLLNPNSPWAPRGQIDDQCVDNNDVVWLLGGGEYYDPHYFNDVWNSKDGITWNKILDAAPWPARVYHNISFFDNKLWVIGGNSGIATGAYDVVDDEYGNRNDVWYSENGVKWYELKNTPWDPRHAASTCVFDSSLWITGGYKNDIWKLVVNNVPIVKTDNKLDETHIKIYPNPGEDFITIEASEYLNQLEVVDVLGRSEIILFKDLNKVDISKLAPGFYILKVNDTVSRFIKK